MIHVLVNFLNLRLLVVEQNVTNTAHLKPSLMFYSEKLPSRIDKKYVEFIITSSHFCLTRQNSIMISTYSARNPRYESKIQISVLHPNWNSLSKTRYLSRFSFWDIFPSNPWVAKSTFQPIYIYIQFLKLLDISRYNILFM